MHNSLSIVEAIVRSMARTAIENEQYFCELDSVVGDGDFGFSLARGFEKVLEDFDTLDRANVGAFLKRAGLIITSRCGGTSGPIWGTGFMKAGAAAGARLDLAPADAVSMLRAAVEGIQKRGGAALGDKTLLDALAPLIDEFEQMLRSGSDTHTALDCAVKAAEMSAQKTSELVAKRGRAAYTGDRSIGSPDAGAVALALMAKNIYTAIVVEADRTPMIPTVQET
jgi:phosphoenolpyruvate---glycerone phosphotransferase subunit DhaL